MSYYGIDPKSNNKIKDILNKTQNLTRAIFPITIILFNDSNKNGTKDVGELGIPNVYITLKDSANVCTSTLTNADGVAAFYPTTVVSGYKVYYTNQNISGTFTDSQFQALNVSPPIPNYLPTTRISTPMTIAPTNTISYGYAYYRPFDCENTSYVIASPNEDGTNLYPSQLYKTSLVTGNKTTIGNFSTGVNPNLRLNALTYNVKDNLLYAYTRYTSSLIPSSDIKGVYRIETTTLNGDKSTTISKVSISFVNSVGQIIPSNIDFLSASSDLKGNYYLSGPNLSEIYKINLNPYSINFGTFVTLSINDKWSISDFAYNPNDNSLYGFNYNPSASLTDPNNLKLIRINLTTLTSANTISAVTLPTDISPINDSAPNSTKYEMSSAFMDLNNGLYMMSASGVIYRVNLNNYASGQILYSTFEKFADGFTTSNSDGANCRFANLGADFGNASWDTISFGMQGYKSLLIQNGPRHGISNSLKLGNTLISEPNANLSPQDNDCLLEYPLRPLDISVSTFNLNVNIMNNTGTTSYIYGWLDFNKDGVFSIDEYITSISGNNVSSITVPVGSIYNTLYKVESIPTGMQTVNLTFSKPLTTTLTQGNTYLRLRLSNDILTTSVTSTLLDDTRSLGPATNGEVEDYFLNIEPIPVLKSTKFSQTVNNTIVRIGDTITYAISISNIGSKSASNVIVKDSSIVSMVSDSIVSIDTNSFKVYTGIDTTTFVKVSSPNLSTGINIGTIASYDFKTLTFNAKVLGCNSCS